MIYLKEYQAAPGLLKSGRDLPDLAAAFLDLLEGGPLVDGQVVGLVAWFKIGHFGVTLRTVSGLAPTASSACPAAELSGGRLLIAQGIRQTEQFQPVRVLLARQ